MEEVENKKIGEVRSFPEGFLWGASTASFQVEGGISNNDWAEAARQGKAPLCGRACDHYSRFESDFDIAKDLGHNAHRFSIEWSRIEPEEGKFDEKEIEHYRAVLRALKARGLTPFVTLWHFTQPMWFSERGGFLHAGAAQVFARYCSFVVDRLGSEAEFWMTINEPQVFAGDGYLKGKFPPFARNLISYLRVLSALMKAHVAAYRAIKATNSNVQVGIATHNIDFDPAENVLARYLAGFLDWFWNHRFLLKTKGCHDFIGLNHYFHHPIGKRAVKDAPRSDMGWEIHPESLYRLSVGLVRYNVPIYITESGLADSKDVHRASYITGYVGAVHRAITDGADVRGYLHWSLLDNYEWAEGFWPRFGLVAIDYATLTRTVRASARVFETIARANAL